MKYYTTCIYVDLETGEQITKEKAIENYIIINHNKTSKYDENSGYLVTTICYECKWSNQLKLF